MESLYNLAHTKIRSALASPLQSSSSALDGNDCWAEDVEGKAGDCWGLPGCLVSHYPTCPDPVSDHTRSLLWRKGRACVSLIVRQAREVDDGERDQYVCQTTSLLSPCGGGRTTSATTPGSAVPLSLCCPKAAIGHHQAGGKSFNQQKENWELTPCPSRDPHHRCGGVMREGGWRAAPQAKLRAVLYLSQLSWGRGVNLLPRPCCQ